MEEFCRDGLNKFLGCEKDGSVQGIFYTENPRNAYHLFCEPRGKGLLLMDHSVGTILDKNIEPYRVSPEEIPFSDYRSYELLYLAKQLKEKI